MNEHQHRQTQTENLARRFRLNGPSESLKQEILASARSAWSETPEGPAHHSPVAPYFAALAATLLLILAIDTLGSHALKPWQSTHTLVVRQFQTPHIEDTVLDEFPHRHRFVWFISHWKETDDRDYRHQLQTLLDQGNQS